MSVYPALPVVILAGGLGTRLRPLTDNMPKSLIEVSGEPFIAHQLRLLRLHHVQKVVLCVGFLGERMCDFVGNGAKFGLKVDYVHDGPQLLGTGGAIKQALPLLDDAFFVLYGDSYLPCNYQAVQATFADSGKMGLMTVFRNNDLWDTSNIEYQAGRIIAYDKKNRTEKMKYIDYGLGVLTQAAFDYLPANQPYDLANLYQDLLKREQLAAYEETQRFYEVGSFTGVKELEYYLSGTTLEARQL